MQAHWDFLCQVSSKETKSARRVCLSQESSLADAQPAQVAQAAQPLISCRTWPYQKWSCGNWPGATNLGLKRSDGTGFAFPLNRRSLMQVALKHTLLANLKHCLPLQHSYVTYILKWVSSKVLSKRDTEPDNIKGSRAPNLKPIDFASEVLFRSKTDRQPARQPARQAGRQTDR